MSEELSLALQLLGIGMGTVFLILSFVVLSGNALIRIVNRYMPAPAKAPKSTPRTGGGSAAIAPDTLAAIVAAVDAVTDGKGKITSIEKK
jgi:oxaloacetate decarboxylase gamma subunit